MWEVFTCGKMPYGRLKNTEVVERVQRGIILERPKACAKEIYEVSDSDCKHCFGYNSSISYFLSIQVMKKCWAHHPEERPSFRILKDQLALVAQGLTD